MIEVTFKTGDTQILKLESFKFKTGDSILNTKAGAPNSKSGGSNYKTGDLNSKIGEKIFNARDSSP